MKSKREAFSNFHLIFVIARGLNSTSNEHCVISAQWQMSDIKGKMENGPLYYSVHNLLIINSEIALMDFIIRPAVSINRLTTTANN